MARAPAPHGGDRRDLVAIELIDGASLEPATAGPQREPALAAAALALVLVTLVALFGRDISRNAPDEGESTEPEVEESSSRPADVRPAAQLDLSWDDLPGLLDNDLQWDDLPAVLRGASAP